MSGRYPDRDPQMFYELARERHAAQADLLNALDSKLFFFLSSSSAILSILVAVYALRPDAFDGWNTASAVASSVAWLLLTGFALNAVRGRAWLSGPKLPDVFERHFSEDDATTLTWKVANHFWHDYNDNTTLVDRKALAQLPLTRPG